MMTCNVISKIMLSQTLWMIDPDFSLKGFIYNTNPSPDYTWVRWVLGVAIFLIILIGLGFILSLLHNKRLQVEIRQRKKSEEALYHYERIISITDDLMSLLDRNYIYQAINESYLQAYRKSRDQIIGHSVADLFGADIFERNIKENFDRCIAGEPINYQSWFNFPGLGRKYMDVKYNPYVGKDGTMLGVSVCARDITEHRKTFNALKKQKEYSEKIVQTSSAIIVGLDKNRKIKLFNQGAEKITGFKSKEVMGNDWFKIFFKPDNYDEMNKVWENAWRAKFNSYVNPILTKNGEEKIISWRTTGMYDEADKKKHMVISIGEDITKRKRAEQALKIEHDKLESVLNGMGEGMYIVDKDYNIEFQNNDFNKHFGDCKGKKCYKSIFKRDEPCQDCLMTETLRTNSFQQNETSFLDGKYYDMSFSPLKQHKGADKIIVLIKDITEKKNFHTEAMRAGHLASLGELAAGVAHEINNPITGIISLAEIISDETGEAGGDVEFPNRIIKEAERIGKIVKNLLSFARDRKEEHSPVHINDILNDAFALTKKQILKDGIHFSVAVSPDIPKINARSQEIQQVFLNIISNARYSLNEKFPRPHVNKIFEIAGEQIEINGKMHVRIIFYDKGMGIADNILNKVSDPFFSTKPQGDGTGLGLSISHGIIISHNGKLWLESREKEYTKVMVDLPIANGWTIKEEV